MDSKNILDRWAELERAATAGPWTACPKKEAPNGWPLAFSMGMSDRDNKGWGLAVMGVPASCAEFGDAADDARLVAFLRNHSAELREVVRAAEGLAIDVEERDGQAPHPAVLARLRAALERLGVR